MRRTTSVAVAMLGLAAIAAALGLAVPAAADSNAFGDSGWELTPQAPADLPAVLCAFRSMWASARMS
jgi:hypothetical protein